VEAVRTSVSFDMRGYLLLMVSVWLVSSQSASAMDMGNGKFEHPQNRHWYTDGPNVPRMAPGDGPSIKMAPNGNRYGHVGDADGRGADGENPSRIFQWFGCADSTSIDPHCTVSFRFRSLLLPGELAWVRMKSQAQQRVWAIPHSNNQWAAGRKSITLPNECSKQIFLEFGMIKQAGGKIGGRLNIDDVEYDCTIGAAADPGGNWHFLPPEPDRDSSRVMPHDEAMLVSHDGGNLWITTLIMVSLALIVFKLRRRSLGDD